MKITGHAAGGFLVSNWFLRNKVYSKKERVRFQILGTLFGIVPDFDYFFYAFKKKSFSFGSDFRHHTWITHTFPFYLSISGLFYLFGLFRNNQKVQDLAKMFSLCTTTHLIQDMVGSGDGIMVFYPISKKMKGVGLINLHGKEWNRAYTRKPIFLVEVLIYGIAIISLFKSMFRREEK